MADAPALVLPQVTRSEPTTYCDAAEAMQRRVKVANHMEHFRRKPVGAPLRWGALWVVFPPGEQIMDGRTVNQLSGGTAELAWWQKDNHLVGVGYSASPTDATIAALTTFDQGNIARLGLEVWFDRGLPGIRPPRYYIFKRSVRDPVTYMPSGKRLSEHEERVLLGLG
jgi:hypothetical protein